LNKLQDVVRENPWLADLPPSCAWAWVALVCHVHQHGSPAGTFKVTWTNPDIWAKLLHVSANDFRVMYAAARKNHAISTKGRSATLIVHCLAHPSALAESTLRTRKYRDRTKTHTMKDARHDRAALKARGFPTPSGFAQAWVVGMNLMAQAGVKDVHVKLMRHWIKEKGKVPICAMSWLNEFVGSSIGREVNLTDFVESRQKATSISLSSE